MLMGQGRLGAAIRYLLTAIVTAAYWFAAASTCFALTGLDPLDLLSGRGDPGRLAGAAAVLVLFVLLFSVLDRRLTPRAEHARG
jgi:hypothetical protein